LLAGRCADSNAFRGDGALAARVASALAALPEIAGNSLWVTVQARWVFLQGCAASAAQAAAVSHGRPVTRRGRRRALPSRG